MLTRRGLIIGAAASALAAPAIVKAASLMAVKPIQLEKVQYALHHSHLWWFDTHGEVWTQMDSSIWERADARIPILRGGHDLCIMGPDSPTPPVLFGNNPYDVGSSPSVQLQDF